MAKVHTDTDVEIHIEFTGARELGGFVLGRQIHSTEETERRKIAYRDQFEKLVRRHVAPHADGEFIISDITSRNYACSGCGSNWTEKSDTFNGGCCDLDMANDPDSEVAA